MPCLDLKILVDEVQQVELLPLVLVEPLGLNVEQCIRTDGYTLLLPEPPAQLLLVFLLDGSQPFQNGGIIRKGKQLFQLGGILVEARSDQAFDLAGGGR